MKKNIIKTTTLLLVTGIALYSCSKGLEKEIPEESNKYKVSIQATKASSKAVDNGGTATFKTTEKVYVYNVNTSTLDANALSPVANASSTKIEGELSGSYSKNDQLLLLYNTNSSGIADYREQNGSLNNVVDAGSATVDVADVSSQRVKTFPAHFSNLQSVFKLRFVNGSETLNIKSVSIRSESNKLQQTYDVVNNTATYGGITFTDENCKTDWFVSLRFDSNPSETIIFDVLDENGFAYTGTKTAPAGGFTNGKFYTSVISVQCHKFSISSSETVYFSPGLFAEDDRGNRSFLLPQHNNQTTWGTIYHYWYYLQDENFLDPDSGGWIDNSVFDWFILSKDEWAYLLEERVIDGGAVDPYYPITTDSNNGSVFGMLIPPDDAKASDVENLTGTNLNSVDLSIYALKGFVFLPNTGYADWDGLHSDVENGLYWTRTLYEDDEEQAYYVEINPMGFDQIDHTIILLEYQPIPYNDYNDYRMAVRLVHK